MLRPDAAAGGGVEGGDGVVLGGDEDPIANGQDLGVDLAIERLGFPELLDTGRVVHARGLAGALEVVLVGEPVRLGRGRGDRAGGRRRAGLAGAEARGNVGAAVVGADALQGVAHCTPGTLTPTANAAANFARVMATSATLVSRNGSRRQRHPGGAGRWRGPGPRHRPGRTVGSPGRSRGRRLLVPRWTPRWPRSPRCSRRLTKRDPRGHDRA